MHCALPGQGAGPAAAEGWGAAPACPPTGQMAGRLCPGLPGWGHRGHLVPGPGRAGAVGQPLPCTNKQNGLCTLFTSFIVKLTPTSQAPPSSRLGEQPPVQTAMALPNLLPALRGVCCSPPSPDPAGPHRWGPGTALALSNGIGGTGTPPLPQCCWEARPGPPCSDPCRQGWGRQGQGRGGAAKDRPSLPAPPAA